jgi:multiple sugar transport system ATP-binding protein
MSGITIRNLSKSFGGVEILKGINLEIDPGEFTVLLGPSGCGKSTLLNLIAGLEQADGGQIMIGDKDMTAVEPSQRGLAMVFQSYALFPTMTVRRNLSFGLTIGGTPKDEIDRRVAWVAGLLQIEHLLDRRPSQLSGGQRQRVAIGRALVRSSKICLFDEPLSNLDAKLRTETRVEIKKLHADLGSTMVYVTHDQIEAMTMADRIAVMRGGHIDQYDAPQAVYDRPMTLFVAGFLGSPTMNFLEGSLSSADASRFVVGDHALPLSGYVFREPTGKVSSAILGVRPEDVKIRKPARGDEPQLRGKIEAVEPLGPDTLVWLGILGKRWSMRLPAPEAVNLPDVLDVTFPAERASLFSKDTEMRL